MSTTIALIGIPNTGKSTVYNGLCGGRQQVSNYPGVTVEKKTGVTRLGTDAVRVVDLPGLYSLKAASPDEQIAVDVLDGRVADVGRPDMVLFVLDATNLERNLFLYSQVIELNLPVFVVLTMTDRLESEGIQLQAEQLAGELGAPLSTVVAGDPTDLKRLRKALAEFLQAPAPVDQQLHVEFPEEVESAAKDLANALSTELPVSQFEAREMLFHDEFEPARRANRTELSSGILAKIRSSIPRWTRGQRSVINYRRHAWASGLSERVSQREELTSTSWSDRIDRVFTHRLLGPVLFFGLMFVMFQSIYEWAALPMDLIEGGLGALGEAVGVWLEPLPMLQSLIVDGIIGGVGSVVVFLPQIIILFLFIALLEDSGYMARAAFLMDRIFSWSGLNGRSFVPVLSGFACAIPAIMATRVMSDARARLVTLLLIPLVSCSARLPVYVRLVGAFIEPQFGAGWAALALFGMHLLGILIGLPLAWLVNDGILNAPALPFVMELPPYRRPGFRNVLFRTGGAAQKFLTKAGTVIFAMSILIWALTYFPHPPELAESIRTEAVEQNPNMHEAEEIAVENQISGAYLEQSYLGVAGRAEPPLFAPQAYAWKISKAEQGSIPAREVLISTLGIIYNSGAVDENSAELLENIRNDKREDGSPVFTVAVALSLMVFIALSCLCMCTVAGRYRELNSVIWPIAVFVGMTVLAYGVSWLFYHGALVVLGG